MVERALERQSSKIAKSTNLSFDADHMLRIRLKEIENSKKQIDVNKNHIEKLKEKLKGVGQQAAGPNGQQPLSWETKYQVQLDLKAKLEKQIKHLEKQNSVQGNAIEKAASSEDH